MVETLLGKLREAQGGLWEETVSRAAPAPAWRRHPLGGSEKQGSVASASAEWPSRRAQTPLEGQEKPGDDLAGGAFRWGGSEALTCPLSPNTQPPRGRQQLRGGGI